MNELVRTRHPGSAVRLRHETYTRADALLEACGEPPEAVLGRNLPLGSYPAPGQFSDAIFHATADAFVLSVQPEVSTGLVRHRELGFLFHPSQVHLWSPEDRDWLKREFVRSDPPEVSVSIANLEAVIERIRGRTEAPILVYNMCPIVPGETVHCLLGLGETFATRVRRLNLGLAELSERTGISVVDVETVIGRAGADAMKLDALHLTPAGNRLVAEEVVRILEDLGVFTMHEERQCA